VKEVESELATLTKQQADMDKNRQETHAEYVQAKSDLEAGLTGVRKALGVLREFRLVGVLQRGAIAGLRLRTLSPNVAALTTGERALPALFTSDVLALLRTAKKTGGLSSFGFGGTCRNEVDTSVPARTEPTAPTVYNRLSFPWGDCHPLLRAKRVGTDAIATYGVSFGSHVLELLSHRIVHGEVVVPGSCFLEMIIAGCGAFLCKDEAWCFKDLGFAKSLVLRMVDG
jgi:hypothetical protein